MDLGSKYGTYVNYGSIGPHVWIDLEEGSVILLGRRRNIMYDIICDKLKIRMIGFYLYLHKYYF